MNRIHPRAFLALLLAIAMSIMMIDTPTAAAQPEGPSSGEIAADIFTLGFYGAIKDVVDCAHREKFDSDANPYMVTALQKLKNDKGEEVEQWTAGGVPIKNLTGNDLRSDFAANKGWVPNLFYREMINFPDVCYKTVVKSNDLDNLKSYKVQVYDGLADAITGLVGNVGELALPLPGVGELVSIILKVSRTVFRAIMRFASWAMKIAKIEGKGAAGIAAAGRDVLEATGKKAAEDTAAKKSTQQIEKDAVDAALETAEKSGPDPLKTTELIEAVATESTESSAFKAATLVKVFSLDESDQLALIREATAIVTEYDPFPLADKAGFSPEAVTERALERSHVVAVLLDIVDSGGDLDRAAALAHNFATQRGVMRRSGGLPGGGKLLEGLLGKRNPPVKGSGFFDSHASGTSSGSGSSGIGGGGGEERPGTSSEFSSIFENPESPASPPSTAGKFWGFLKGAQAMPKLWLDEAPSGEARPRERTIKYLKDLIAKNKDKIGNKPTVAHGVLASVEMIRVGAGELGARDVNVVFEDPELVNALLSRLDDTAANSEVAQAEISYWKKQNQIKSSPGTLAALAVPLQDRIGIQMTLGQALFKIT